LAEARGDREDEVRSWRAVLAKCPGGRETTARMARQADIVRRPRRRLGAMIPVRPAPGRIAY
jgi:hypothetical protein